MSVASQIVARHFASKTLRTLAKNGITVVSSTFVPGKSGTYIDGETAYNINDNGTGRVWSFLETLAKAK